ncbi:MAG TPA: peptidoglycan editing factor PgeF [Bryobacteraceae bacterium]|nr:peptidoglycan editing factor PgeF [Bryobacteraceae bacterium]
MLKAANLSRFSWVEHGFGFRDSEYPDPIATLRQVHSGRVFEACPPTADRFAEGDALVTNAPGLRVGVRTADCVPVLILDERTRAVAAIHAGWRGTAENIVSHAVYEMMTRYGTRQEDLHAAIGPSIGACCYEVGNDVALRFDPACRESNAYIDLPSINERQLTEAGVPDIWIARECTFCLPQRYFSFRREKEEAGRMISFIGARESV